MKHRAISKLLLSLWLLHPMCSQSQAKCAAPESTTDPKFAPGQVWTYKARPNEPDSTITILRIERTPKLGTIVHVRIDGVHFSKCTGGPAPTTIEHAPFLRSTIEASVNERSGFVSKLPDYDAGYRDWLSHCGGAYSITVAQAVALDDTQFNVGLGCK